MKPACVWVDSGVSAARCGLPKGSCATQQFNHAREIDEGFFTSHRAQQETAEMSGVPRRAGFAHVVTG